MDVWFAAHPGLGARWRPSRLGSPRYRCAMRLSERTTSGDRTDRDSDSSGNASRDTPSPRAERTHSSPSTKGRSVAVTSDRIAAAADALEK